MKFLFNFYSVHAQSVHMRVYEEIEKMKVWSLHRVKKFELYDLFYVIGLMLSISNNLHVENKLIL